MKVPADQGLPRSPDPSGRANNTPEARGNADPVNPANGELYMDRLDLGFPGFGVELAHGRTYRSRIDYSGVLGPAWDSTYNRRLLAVPESRRLERGMPYPAVQYESTGSAREDAILERMDVLWWKLADHERGWLNERSSDAHGAGPSVRKKDASS